MADLTQVGTSYLQTFLRAKIEEKSPLKFGTTAKKIEIRVPARSTPIGEMFRQLSSQIPDSGSASLTKETAEAKASAEPELTEAQLEALINDPVANIV